jgi:hypothetical protein
VFLAIVHWLWFCNWIKCIFHWNRVYSFTIVHYFWFHDYVKCAILLVIKCVITTNNIIWSPKFECILYRFIANKAFVIRTTLVHIIYYHICPKARNFLNIKAPSNSNLILFLSVKSQTLHLVWDAPQQPLPLWKEFSCLVPCGGLSYTDIFIYNTIYVLTSTNFISIIYNYIPSQYTQRASSIKHPIWLWTTKFIVQH